MKKWILFILPLFLLLGCSKENQYQDYIEAQFTGINGAGTANVTLNKEKLAQELYNYKIPYSSLKNTSSGNLLQFIDLYSPFKNQKMKKILDSFRIEVDQTENLKNGDSIQVTLFWGENNQARKTIKVSNLTRGTIISRKEIEEGLDIELSGVSGRGTINTSWGGTSNIYVKFDVPKNGTFANGDVAEISVSEETTIDLARLGYELESTEPIPYTISNLPIIPEEIDTLPGVEGLKNKINTYISNKYSSTNAIYNFEIIPFGSYYRQFVDEENNDILLGYTKHGQLVNAYKIRIVYKSNNQLDREYILLYGYQNFFDLQGNIDTSTATEILYDGLNYNLNIEKALLDIGFKKLEK